MGDRYSYAGQGPNRFDCSGLVYYNYATMNMWLPRRAIDQSKVGKTVSVDNLIYGDLIFFDTHRHFRGRVNHVGIYVGNGLFTHASSAKRRVTTSSLKKRFYRSRIVVCKRLISRRGSITPKSTKPLRPQAPKVENIVKDPIVAQTDNSQKADLF
ncbi:Invasion associated protein p60 [hydrothermal vent metagenome]|uniref:Invasion associated protein p60 n=1 Tax=hydrothermal vent metagenome TaxID=652676 RepID=A0A1W1BEL0_9ZZZZ